MSMTPNFGENRPGLLTGERSVWIVLIVTSGACFSPFFACVTPFAGLATVAALKLSWRDGFATIGLIWFINQVIGYFALGYPWQWDSFAWGLAIGASSGLAIMAARGLSATRPVPLAVSLPFMAAFVVFEVGLFVAGLVLPGSDGGFTASVIGHVFLINASALCGVMALYNLAMMLGLIARASQPALLNVDSVTYR